MSYLTNDNWSTGYQSPQQQTANKVDHLADNINLVLRMMNSQVIGIDGIEDELKALANGGTPPRREQLLAMAGRLDACQDQIKESLGIIKDLAKSIDQATDAIQNAKSVW